MSDSNQSENRELCKSCSKPLPELQVRQKLKNPKYQEWCREGYCSYPCFEKSQPVKATHMLRVTAPSIQEQSRVESSQDWRIKRPQAGNDQNIIARCIYVGGGIFCMLNIAMSGSVPGGFKGGIVGGAIGAVVGYIIIWMKRN